MSEERINMGDYFTSKDSKLAAVKKGCRTTNNTNFATVVARDAAAGYYVDINLVNSAFDQAMKRHAESRSRKSA